MNAVFISAGGKGTVSRDTLMAVIDSCPMAAGSSEAAEEFVANTAEIGNG